MCCKVEVSELKDADSKNVQQWHEQSEQDKEL